METPDIKGEYDAEALQCKNMHLNDDDDDDEEMPLLTPEVDTATLLSKYKEEVSAETCLYLREDVIHSTDQTVHSTAHSSVG